MNKFIVGLLFVPCIANAEFLSGNMLLQRINAESTVERMVALGYVMGVSDVGQGRMHCSGAQVTSGQTRDVVRQYLEQNPSIRDLSADILVSAALAQAWPCANKKNGKGV